MKSKSFDSSQSFQDFEQKDQNVKYILSKFDFDLFDEESNKPTKVIRVKRFNLPNKGEKWKILEDTKVIFVVEGAKISVKEKEFLRTADGVNFLIQRAKEGIKSLNSLRAEIKNILK